MAKAVGGDRTDSRERDTELKQMFWRYRKTRDVKDEIEAHLRLEADLLREQGLSEDDAMALARRRFGNPTRAVEKFYEGQKWFAIFNAAQDLRFGLRLMGKAPGATLITGLILSLALGGSSAIFSVLSSVALTKLPVNAPNDLVLLSDPNASMTLGGMVTGERTLFTFPEFTRLRDRATTLSGVCASQLTLQQWPVSIGSAPPEMVRGRLVSENYFSVLGVQAGLGRLFSQSDAKGPGHDPYAVISYDYWQRRFGGDRTVVGRSFQLRHAAFVVVGIAHKGFHGDAAGQEPDLWLPMLMQPVVMPSMDGLSDMFGESQNKLMWLHVYGRRRAGVPMGRVQAEMNVLFREMLATDYGPMQPKEREKALQQYISVKPGSSGVMHGRKALSQQWSFLTGLALLVLLIACANVAAVQMARATVRSREIAVRMSLGAGRARLICQFLTESLLMALLSGGAGVLVAYLLVQFLVKTISNSDLKISAQVGPSVLIFGACTTLLAGVLIGFAVLLQATRGRRQKDLSVTGPAAASTPKSARFAKSIVVAQMVLCFPLVAGAGLFLQTMWNLQAVALGYPREHLLVVELDSANAGYSSARVANLLGGLTRRLREIPEVSSVTYSGRGLFSGFEGAFPITVNGFVQQREADRGSTGDFIGPDYFLTIGIPITAGRELKTSDMGKTPRSAVVNESFARKFFGGTNAVGRYFTTVLSSDDGKEGPRQLEVVGVVQDVRVQSLRGSIDPKFYVPGNGSWMEIRTKRDPLRASAAIRKTILSAGPAIAIQRMDTVDEMVARQNAPAKLVSQLATGFGALGLVLVAMGVYGLLSFRVAGRIHELGVRMALGADKTNIFFAVLRETGGLMAMGAVGGFLAALVLISVLSRELEGAVQSGPRWSLASYEHVDSAIQLFGLRAMDLRTIGIALGLLLALGLLAAMIPARRAASVQPMRALRGE